MQLRGKSAVVYGANSPAGAFVARAFATAGATVYLAGRSPCRLEPLAHEIVSAGGAAVVARVDPLDPKSVSEHLHDVYVQHGSVDVSLNMAFQGVLGPARLCNLTDQQFDAATFTRVRTNFVTAAAAARKMAYQGRGIILAMAVPEAGYPGGDLAGQRIASAAIESLCEQLRDDVGSFGVRVSYIADPPSSGEELVQKLFQLLAAVPPSSRAVTRETDASSVSPRGEASVVAATS
ncbi:MAG: SDR family NAD(P)-dependent oxidoreductase [Thermoplasmata archaeon]|nr:SDR family NAD(P)-dependent oxidoreductase [Thermoplasmata archaeon]